MQAPHRLAVAPANAFQGIAGLHVRHADERVRHFIVVHALQPAELIRRQTPPRLARRLGATWGAIMGVIRCLVVFAVSFPLEAGMPAVGAALCWRARAVWGEPAGGAAAARAASRYRATGATCAW